MIVTRKKARAVIPGDRIVVERGGMRTNERVVGVVLSPLRHSITLRTRSGDAVAEMELGFMDEVEILNG